jgi:ABC-type glutathione transport system ATPase component
MSALLTVDSLERTFTSGPPWARKHVHAVKGVSFHIDKGETYGLVGESGSGKSTVARLVSRLDVPNAGTISLNDRDIAGLKGAQLKQLRKDVQMIFQDPYSALNTRMTVEEIISEPLKIHGLLDRAGRRARVFDLLDKVEMPKAAAQRKPVEFSGGQRQRIMIARALVLEPRVLVADEPVSALDVSVQAQVLNLLRDLQQQLDLAVLFISHDLSVVDFVSDRIGVMYKGELLEEATANEILTNPKTDYTKALLAAVPRIDAARGGAQ